MADPISLVASILAIATAAAQIGKAISRLRAFGEVSNQTFALKNEITDLELVLRQVSAALQQKTFVPVSERGSLEQILARTKTLLSDLAKEIEKFAETCAGHGTSTINRSIFKYKSKTLFQGHQEKIRGVKETLNMMLGASNSRDLRHIKLELRQIAFLTSTSQQNGQQNIKMVSEALANNHVVVSQQLSDMGGRLEALGQMLHNERLRNETQSGQGSDNPPGYTEKPPITSANIETVQILLSKQTTCRGWCPCTCHGKRKLNVRVPGMEGILGKMFLGYTGLPVLNNPCDFRGCKDRQQASATMEYWFPWWFVTMNMKLQLKLIPRAGPEFQLSTTRRVPDSSQSITFAMQGNIEGLKNLFSAGLAGPRDVSASRGYSLMRWALYGGMHNYETVHFLISQGAKVDDISYDNVWDFLMRGKCNPTEAQALRCITEGGEDDWLEEQNFPLIHRIIFGLSSKSLAAELEENPNAVYITDAQGRSALDWATARIQLGDMTLLLKHGSDPNNMDVTGRTPVLHAVDSHSAECLRVILEGGGNPNIKTPKGLFRSSPLTAAGFAGMTSLLKLLLDFGAEPNACNPEGLTALHSVARTHNVDCALLLLECGANLNAVSSNGGTPLTTAIVHNNHPVIKLFVDRCYDYITTLRFGGPQVLPIIAEHADAETISILASSHPLKLSLDLSANGLAKSRAILEQRQDYNEKLSAAFEELTVIAQAEESIAGSINSLQESGLFFSARSSFHSDLAEAISRLNSTTVSSSAASETGSPVRIEYSLVEGGQSEGEALLGGATERVQW